MSEEMDQWMNRMNLGQEEIALDEIDGNLFNL
jgi:hypothetical protein